MIFFFFYKELIETKESIDKVVGCKGPWGRVVPSVRENFAWDFEEATAINIVENQEIYLSELKDFVSKYIKNEQIRQALSIQPLLLGGNPLETTSIYNLTFSHPCKSLYWFMRNGNYISGNTFLSYLPDSTYIYRSGYASENTTLLQSDILGGIIHPPK